MSKTSLTIVATIICTAVAQADLRSLGGEELEQETVATKITAFQSADRPASSPPDDNSSSPGHNELLIQQELNTIDIRIIRNSRPSSLRLENQVLHGPNSGVEVNNNNLLDF